MTLLAVVTLCCATVLIIAAGAERVLSAKWQAERTIQASAIANEWDRQSRLTDVRARRVAVLERRVALEERRLKDSPTGDPMPADLLDRINAWEDDFAKDDQRRVIADLYAEYRDWDKVRQRLEAPAPATDRIAAPREGLIQ